MDVWALESVVATADKLKRPLRILLNRVPPRLGSLEEVLGALGQNRALLLATQLGNRNGFSQGDADRADRARARRALERGGGDRRPPGRADGARSARL